VPNAVNIESNHLNVGESRELPIAHAVVKVPMRVDYKQRERRCPSPRQQVHHRLREGHLIRICDVAGIDEKRLRRSDDKVHEWRFERSAKTFPENECLRVVGVYLEWRLRTGLAVFRAFIPVDVQCPGDELRLGGCGRERRKNQQRDDHRSDGEDLVKHNHYDASPSARRGLKG
jgi:hypothetical protein